MFKIVEKDGLKVKVCERAGTRASGRKRAKGIDKATRNLERRRLAYSRLSVVDQATMPAPGTMKKPD